MFADSYANYTKRGVWPWFSHLKSAAALKLRLLQTNMYTYLFPLLCTFWFLEKNVLYENCVNGTVLMIQLTLNSLTCAGVGQSGVSGNSASGNYHSGNRASGNRIM